MQGAVKATIGALALLALGAPAQAAPTTFDFTVGPQGLVGNPLVCDPAAALAGACGITGPGSATIQGWAFQGNSAPLSAANLYQDSSGGIGDNGIGIRFDGADAGTNPGGTEIDNNGPDEFMSITFGAAFEWELVSITLSRFGYSGTTGADRIDTALFWGSNDPLGTTTNWTQLTATRTEHTNSNPGASTFTFTGLNPELTFDHIYVTTGFDDEDDFRLAGVVGSTDVPEPATLALLGLGLVGIGAASRRRKTA